jgi:hypothetical protein
MRIGNGGRTASVGGVQDAEFPAFRPLIVGMPRPRNQRDDHGNQSKPCPCPDLSHRARQQVALIHALSRFSALLRVPGRVRPVAHAQAAAALPRVAAKSPEQRNAARNDVEHLDFSSRTPFVPVEGDAV